MYGNSVSPLQAIVHGIYSFLFAQPQLWYVKILSTPVLQHRLIYNLLEGLCLVMDG